MKRAVTVTTAVWILISTAPSGAEAPRGHLVPDGDWNNAVKVWVARAMVSEAGWDETADHIALAYVLLRRWRLARQHHPKLTMSAVVKKYCAGFRGIPFTARQRWVRNLTLDATRPEGWPSDISWDDYRDRWVAVLDLVESWRLGEHDDPCRGLSMYWGGAMDRPSSRMIPMDCGTTKNRFYTVKPLVENP